MPATIVALDGWDSVVGWDESPWGSGRIDLAEMQGGVGDVTLSIGSSVSVTGLSATCSVGSVTLSIDSPVSVAGVSAAGYVGSVLVWDQIVPNQNPNWGSIAPSQSPDWIEIAA